MRNFGSLLVEGATTAARAYDEQASGWKRSFSRVTGQAGSNFGCYYAEYPLFATSLVHFDDAGLFSRINALSQYVLFSHTAVCDKVTGKVTFASGEVVDGRGVVVVQGGRCSWPLPQILTTSADGPTLGVITSKNCEPLGHVMVEFGPNGPCFRTVAHVIKGAAFVVYRTPSDKSSSLKMVVDMAWQLFGEYAQSGACSDSVKSLTPGSVCALFTYSMGLGVVTRHVSVTAQVGSPVLFGVTDFAVKPGTSGSPCIASNGAYGLVSAVVRGGVEVVPVPFTSVPE